MKDLFIFLHDIENTYSRTIFNFHLIKDDTIGDIYKKIKDIISVENLFDNIVKTDDVKKCIKKLVYCDIHITKHVINPLVYHINEKNKSNCKCSQFFDINTCNDNISTMTAKIFDHDKSSLVSYIKTTNKKKKIDYGEIKKTIHGTKTSCNYFCGKKSDDYLVTTIKTTNKPWIKTMSKRMRIDIINNAIITKGKSSILQTIEIIFVNRTCVKIFKDSTMHIILSKEKMEQGCIGLIDKLFNVYQILFRLLYDITHDDMLDTISNYYKDITDLDVFEDKINKIDNMKTIYGINNFKVGMFNLTYNYPITHTVFPSLLGNDNKIKFFKGKKLNIVALKSLSDCRTYVELANSIIKNMSHRSEILDNLNIESVSIETLKELLTLN
ncbi:SPV112 putative intermediate transcription factor VITF-3 [Swinepox virus]|uniref:Intermediate transcription factor 3 large subunit n=1 Tax=Swinepox virus (strain Swine/Nebraska/17077-99/1999) TaxID=300880 RepID=Q8V3I4_SWPV1|nr:SPV112 putative intermediate transcription factor VITF-3 [Swinepox virus]AAL69851.1 SPV112 putative intermediate transcription factor VITF-3 [Swinepox virus]UUA44302.1 SPV112 [Swinepox virus]